MQTIQSNLATNQTLSGDASSNQFLEDVLLGLSKPQKTLPSKYFYDQTGAKLFQQICELSEYYPTRIEFELLQKHSSEIAHSIGTHAAILEPGAGAKTKARLLLDAQHQPKSYIPDELTKETHIRSITRLRSQLPDIQLHSKEQDFLAEFKDSGEFEHICNARRILFFPGSTIGHFDYAGARRFLAGVGQEVGRDGGCLIGVDLVKDRNSLIEAYNDNQGITASFNKNLLNRVNKDLAADFVTDNFFHQAIFNENESRVEMHLVSLKPQQVTIEDRQFSFRRMESIHTENSYKYSIESFTGMARQAGFARKAYWTDAQQWFAIFYLVGI